MRIGRFIVAPTASLLIPAASWAQCAMCRTAVTGSEEGRMLAEGLNKGILLLVSVPFFLVGLFVLRVILLRWRAGRAPLADTPAASVIPGRTLVRKVGNFTLSWKRETP